MHTNCMQSHNVYYVIKLSCFPYHATYKMIVHAKLTFGNNAPWSACNGHCNVLHLALARTLRCIINGRSPVHRNLTSIQQGTRCNFEVVRSGSGEKIKSISKCRIVNRESCSQKLALYTDVMGIGIAVLFSCSLISIYVVYLLTFVCFTVLRCSYLLMFTTIVYYYTFVLDSF